MTAIVDPVGCWWLDDGDDSGVWPCDVVDVNVLGVVVRQTHPDGPYAGNTITVPRGRVYDSDFNRPAREGSVA